MSAAFPPRGPATPEQQQEQRDAALRTREAQASATAQQGARTPEPTAPNAPYARILGRMREIQRVELEQRQGLRPATLGGSPPFPNTDAAAFAGDPSRREDPAAAGRRDNLALGATRVLGEGVLGYATGGLSLGPRVLATGAGEAGIEALFGLASRGNDQNRGEHVVEDLTVGAVTGAGSELALAGGGAIVRGGARLGMRVVRGVVSARAASLEREAVRAYVREFGTQATPSVVRESPMLSTIEQYVENSFGGRPLREVRAKNIETIRQQLLDQTELVPSPKSFDLDFFLQETLDGRLDAARGYAASYYKTVFDRASGASGGVRFFPKVPAEAARAALADERLGLAALQDDTYKSVLTEMMTSKNVTFERMQRWRSDLFAYSQMFDPSGRVKQATQASAAKMAHQLTQSMEAASKAMGLGDEWLKANQIWADEVRGVFTTRMLRRIVSDEPTKVAQALLRNGTGREVSAIRKALGIAEDGSYRPIVTPTTREGVLAAKEQERAAREAWNRLQGAHLWNSVIDASQSGVDYAALRASGQARQALAPSGDRLLQNLFSRGDANGSFIRELYNTPESKRLFNQTVKLADTLRFYQAAPEGGGIAMRVIQANAVISIGVGAAAGLATGDLSAAGGAATGTGAALLIGERGMASLFASPRFVSALENGIRAPRASMMAKRAGLVLAIEVLRDSAVSDEVRAQADAMVAQLSSSVGVTPEEARRAAGVDATGFVSRAKPQVSDRMDVGGIR